MLKSLNITFKICITKDTEIKLDFYRDSLQENFLKISTVSKMSIVAKKTNFKLRKRCNWTKPTNCKKETKTPCMNQFCKKVACTSHSTKICYNCTQLSDFTEKHISLNNGRTDKKKYCSFIYCSNQSNKQCAILECKKIICGTHEFKLCQDCISL